MAVYTILEREDFEKILSLYNLGSLHEFEEVESGIENTNYILTFTKNNKDHRYVFTLFEELPAEHVPYHVDLLNELSNAGLPVPVPVSTKQGKYFQLWQGKPYVIVSFLKGQHVHEPTPEQCGAIAEALARFHLTAINLPQNHAGIRGIAWLEECVSKAHHLLDEENKALTEKYFQEFLALDAKGHLPKGIIHGDLFRDNTLFEGGQLTGLIDFYSAGEGYLLYDFAVLVNDWCSNADGSLDKDRFQAAAQGYQSLRPFCEEELSAIGLVNQIAAMRFWLSRLLYNETREQTHPEKDPAQFKRIFLQRIADPIHISP